MIFAQIKAARAWLTLVGVAIVAAWLYWQLATLRKDRDALLAFSEVTCASAGSPFPASNGPGGKLKRGEACRQRVRDLAQLELDVARASNEALKGALDDHATKSRADASAAARHAASAEAAVRKMEQADNAITSDNRVSRHWFDALNNIAGLRPPHD
jgi:hypothetical protein